MCGITGFYANKNEKLLHEMCDCIIHRGPDESGFYRDESVGLSIRRLSIIDLSGGHQPIKNEDGNIVVTLNGEIYNYRALSETLKQQGHVFTTHSDTETIVHLYEEHGLDFVQHLRGMFGIAIWDMNNDRFVLARDRIGEKPLYYAVKDGEIFYGSEIKAILPALNTRSVDKQSVCDFFAAGYVAGERTFFKEIKKLLPGQMLISDRGEIRLVKYWENSYVEDPDISYEEAERQTEELLQESVALCLESDVEVGAFLSGGVDSSLLVALLKEQKKSVRTYSVGYKGEAAGFNELSYAKKVADHLGTEHKELILEANSSIDLLPKLIWHYDEPHGEPTSTLVYELCEFVAKELKVAIGGTGGDELYYGYPRHKGIRYLQTYNRIPGFLRKNVFENIVHHMPESTKGSRLMKRVKRFVSGAGKSPEEAYLEWVNMIPRDDRMKLYAEETLNEVRYPEGDEFMKSRLLKDAPDLSIYGKLASLDIEGYLSEYQLCYMDRMSMAVSLEVRSPLCDYRLTEAATALPAKYRLKNGTSKYILKNIARKRLPTEIVDRKKVGFDSPIGQWFKTDLRGFIARFLSHENIDATGILDPAGVQNIIDAHMMGRKDYSLQLWSVIAFEMWYRMYIEAEITTEDDLKSATIRGLH